MPGIMGNLLGLLQRQQADQDRSASAGFAARRGAGSRKLWRAAANNYTRMPRVGGGTITRQRARAAARAIAFASVTSKFPGEPRAARRRMARAIAKRDWRSAAGGR
jgi:hypothetical protein